MASINIKFKPKEKNGVWYVIEFYYDSLTFAIKKRIYKDMLNKKMTFVNEEEAQRFCQTKNIIHSIV